MNDDDLEEKAKEWVRNNKRFLINKFADINKFPGVSNPFTIFMAGCPGAGKTEYSKSFIAAYPDHNTKIVRIDADEIRDEIPGYTGVYAYKFQGAAAIGVEKLFDYIQDHKQNAIVDGTFSDFKIGLDNIERALHRSRKVGIFYLYQDPVIAWEFTKKREQVEGRHVSKEMFIKSFLLAKENVNKVKAVLKDQVELNLVEKNYLNELGKTRFKIDNVDSFLKKLYNKEELEELLS